MRTHRMLYLFASLAVLLCGLWGGGRMAFVLFSLLCILPILSGLCLYLSGRGVCLSLKGTRASCRCGQEMEVTIEMEYPLIPPAGKVWVELICENRVFGIRKELSCLLEPGNGRRQEYRLSLDTSLCGNLSVRAERLFCHDPLGLFSSKRSPKKEFLYTVYPFEVPMYVSLNRNREREQTGDIYDGRKSGTDVSEVFGLREYREGDPLQSIHWKLSGKMKQLIVREFGRPVNYHTLILLAPAFVYGEKEVGWEIGSAVFCLGCLNRRLVGCLVWAGWLSPTSCGPGGALCSGGDSSFPVFCASPRKSVAEYLRRI